MRTNLLEFLFGSTTTRKSADIGEAVVHLFEQAEAAELEPVKSEKKPLAAALKSFDIDEPVIAGVQWCEIHCSDDKEYKEYITRLTEPDAMNKLAEMGWVMVRCGDIAMGNEEPDYKIGFIEVQTAEGNDMDKADEKIKEIVKKGQEFASTPVATDDESNPVERETGKPDAKITGKTTGVGKPKEGDDPEGKPKGSTKKVSEARLQEWDKRTAMSVLKQEKEKEDMPGTYYGHKSDCGCKLCCVRKTKAERKPKVKESAKTIASKLLDEMTGTSSMGALSGGSFPPLGAAAHHPSRQGRLCCRCRKPCPPGDSVCAGCKGKSNAPK